LSVSDHDINREAFCEAVLACKDRLWAYALRLTRDRAEAEDLLQLTYMRAFESWTQLRSLESAQTWLKRTMHRAFVDKCRRRAIVPMEPMETALPAEGPVYRDTGHGARAEARDALHKALATLTTPFAQALTLRDAWGFSYEEIAELMDCPVGTVRSRIARARAQMLEAMRSDEAMPSRDRGTKHGAGS